MTIDLKTLTVQKVHDALVRGDFTAVELADAYLAEIKQRDVDVHAYLEIFSDVKAQAESADKKIKEGKATLLTGIPFAIKDNILIKGRVASSASKMLEDYTAPYDATVIQKLKAEGVVFLGRTNMDEFAMGGSTENSAYGVTRNPHDTSRVAGGSSGGSAGAVGGLMALVALGSDTGGSIRQPASFCGIVGLKPTYGAVSRHGVMAMGSSLDQIGPMTRTVTDAEIVFNVLREKDGMDSTTISEDTYKTHLRQGSGGQGKPVIGVPREFLKGDGIAPDVLKNFDESLEKLKAQGYEIRDISLPNISYSLAVYYVLMPAEVSSNMARFDGVKYGLHVDGANLLEDYEKTRRAGFGAEVRRRILLGTYVLSAGYADQYYAKANAVKELLREDFRKAFESVDLVLTPTAPTPAFKVGEKSENPLEMYLADIFTVTANLVGTPAISVPSGTSKVDGKDLPLGIQFTAPHGREDLLFAVGKDFLGE